MSAALLSTIIVFGPFCWLLVREIAVCIAEQNEWERRLRSEAGKR